MSFLIFDQFEELFTVVHAIARTAIQLEVLHTGVVRSGAGRVPKKADPDGQLLRRYPGSPGLGTCLDSGHKGGRPDVKCPLDTRGVSPEPASTKPCIPSIFDKRSGWGRSPRARERGHRISGAATRRPGDDAFSSEPASDVYLEYCRRIKVGGSSVSGERSTSHFNVCQHLDRRRRTVAAKSITLRTWPRPGNSAGRRRYYRDLLRDSRAYDAVELSRWYRPSLRNLILGPSPRSRQCALRKGLSRRQAIETVCRRASLPAIRVPAE